MLFSLDRNRKSANALLGLGLLLPLTIPGCGSPEVAVIAPVDSDKARGILTNALDAWKAGKDSNSLASQSPSVRVADEDWLAGMQLVSYEVDPKEKCQVIGTGLSCPVSISLKDKAGKALKKRVSYNVVAEPNPSVIRQD